MTAAVVRGRAGPHADALPGPLCHGRPGKGVTVTRSGRGHSPIDLAMIDFMISLVPP